MSEVVEIFEDRILAPLDAADLESHDLLRADTSPGFQRLHKRRLNRSSDEENKHIPLVDLSNSQGSEDAFVRIPRILISRETLVYVGFSEDKATEIWDRWTNWPAHGPRRETDLDDDGGLRVYFEDFISGQVEFQLDATGENDEDWQRCLGSCGMSGEVQRAIMDPRFRYLRLSDSCVYWVKDTVEMRYAGLRDIQATSRIRDTDLRHVASQPTRYQQGQGRSQSDQDVGTDVSASTSQPSRHSMPEFQRQGASIIESECWSSAGTLATENPPGYVMLYKGMDRARISRLFDEAGAEPHLEELSSTTPTDFSGARARFCFTPDYEVAELHAAYAKHRSSCESIVILRFPILTAPIESLSPPEIQRLYWPSDEWKELVWYSRGRRMLPLHLRKYRESLLIIGAISRGSCSQYQALNSWEDITQRHVLHVRMESPATQYVFSGEEEGYDFLVENGARDMEVFRYSQSDLQEWLRDAQSQTPTPAISPTC